MGKRSGSGGLATVRVRGRAERALVGVRERWHGQARAGTANLFAWGGLAVAVFPHPCMVGCGVGLYIG